MEKFISIVIDGDECQGTGFFEKTVDGIEVESSDDKVLDLFSRFIKRAIKVPSITFQKESGHSSFRGPLLVTRIEGDYITLENGY